ncbi:MAG: MoxR-like ATPase [Candidatus Sumerlaeota bacterium]|nr:MoxR-like ATPase [Candidatus Sumerlaeota bacterium]
MADHAIIQRLRDNIATVYHGSSEVVDLCIVALLARGHLLFEDVPGVGKTTLASVLAGSINCSFRRIQFTSDLLPSDILGVTIYRKDSGEFEFKQGPLFANIVLADEINRSTPKTQSALLEAMNNARVSMDGQVYPLPRPFMVLATQNPLESHGTFPLPNSQMDRFVMRLHLGYPERDKEMMVLREQRLAMTDQDVKPVVDAVEIVALQEAVANVRVDDDLLQYIVRIGEATRESPKFEIGCSTRGLLALRRSAQAWAYVNGREYATPDDIQHIAIPVLAHRVQFARTFERATFTHEEDQAAIRHILEQVEVPL